jgi:hypothetical protein
MMVARSIRVLAACPSPASSVMVCFNLPLIMMLADDTEKKS